MAATTNLTNLPSEIIQTHILSKLDGSDLGSIACTCSQFSLLTNDKTLWRQFCCSKWKSTDNPQISQLISTFSSGYRSFVFDSDAVVNTRFSSTHQPFQPWMCPELLTIISAVDIYYDDKPIFSRVRGAETNTTKFLCTPFRFGLLEPKETVSTPIRSESDMDVLLRHLKEKLTLSWIVIDPIGKRAANMSSRNPVSIEWPCTAGEVQLCYSTVFLAGDRRPGFKQELVECRVVVTCSGFHEGDVVQVNDVSIEIKDTKGRNFDGRESLVILQEALESRRERRKGEEVKKYKEFKEKKMETKEGNKMTADGFLLIVCFGVMGFVAFLSSLILLFVFTVQARVTKSYRKIKMYMSKLSQLWR